MAASPYPHSDRELLRRISRAAGGKAGYKQLVRELGLGGGRERRLLLEQLSGMVKRGELRTAGEGMWALPVSSHAVAGAESARTHSEAGAHTGSRSESSAGSGERLFSGRLELHRDGYGFVRPESRGAGAASAGHDIFIPAHAVHGAMHGDLVLVAEDDTGRERGRSGRVARVLTRRNPTLVGIFHYGRRAARGSRRERPDQLAPYAFSGNFVQPFDERLGAPVAIPPGAELIHAEGTSTHRTLGSPTDTTVAAPNPPSARDERWPLEGMAVEVELITFAQSGRPAQGRLIEVLGPPDAFGVDVEIVIRKHLIPHTFPEQVLAEAAERAVEAVSGEELARREDFRDLPVVTIDGETARDFDDAVLVRSLPNGHTELQVHIADVSWYVRAGSALDTEARLRGTSVYFPDRAVPMLPHALSSGICSLLAHRDRFTLSCIMETDGDGEVLGYRVTEGVIRSVRRMTYTAVQQCLNASPSATAWNGAQAPPDAAGMSEPSSNLPLPGRAPVTPPPTVEDRAERERIAVEQPELPDAFDRMLELALRLNRKRTRRGSIDFDLPEPVVEFDPDGNMKAIVRSERGWAHRLIEEFMLSANECVATWLTAQDIPAIYRIHEMPDPKRILEFEDTAAGFGQTLGIGAFPVRRLTLKADRREAQRRSAAGRGNRPAQAVEIPESVPVTPQMYQRLVRRIQGRPEERILAYLMLRSLKQARYSEKNEGHFALASPCYTHFTSPIRRYPDLIVHRLVRSMLRRGADPRGGPLLSSDPQPWASHVVGRPAPPQNRPPSASAPAPGLSKTALRRGGTDGRQQPGRETLEEGSFRAVRDGRIGWTPEMTGATATERIAPGTIRKAGHQRRPEAAEEPLPAGDPISAHELADIALESSQAERRAADAERELMEWKKMRFMADKVGDVFAGIILSVTKFGFFVELNELFVEGLVPLGSLVGDFYAFRDADRTICGTRTGHCFRVGDPVQVLLDRIDRQQRRLQFALLPGTQPVPQAGKGSLRSGKSEAKREKAKATQQKAKGRKRSRR